MRKRTQRFVPLLFGVVSVVVALVLLVTSRTAPRELLALVVAMLVGLRQRDRRPRRWDRGADTAPRSRRFALGPVLEGRAHRERAGQAVRLLVSDGARRRMNLGVAAVTVVRSVGALVPVVLECDEGAGRRSIRMGHAAFGHRADDTRPARPRPV